MDGCPIGLSPTVSRDMEWRGSFGGPQATIESSCHFTGADLSASEKATIDQIVESLRIRPSFSGDIHIWGFDYGDMHIRRSGGVYVMYQLFRTVFPRAGEVRISPYHVVLWHCGHCRQDDGYLWIDCLPEPMRL